MSNNPKCLNESKDCKGPVEYRIRADGLSFPRCDFHWDQRLETEQHIKELESPFAPDWFDPLDAGERWDEDD